MTDTYDAQCAQQQLEEEEKSMDYKKSNFYTKAQYNKLRKNDEKDGEDHKPVVKLFNAMGGQTWLLSELDGYNIAFGLCDLGFGCPELGYVSLTELEEAGNCMIERDLYFTADMTLSEYASEARKEGGVYA